MKEALKSLIEQARLHLWHNDEYIKSKRLPEKRSALMPAIKHTLKKANEAAEQLREILEVTEPKEFDERYAGQVLAAWYNYTAKRQEYFLSVESDRPKIVKELNTCKVGLRQLLKAFNKLYPS